MAYLTYTCVYKKHDANGHPKVVPISPFLHKRCHLDFFKVPVVLFVRHLEMLKSKKLQSFVRKRRKLGQLFDLEQT